MSAKRLRVVFKRGWPYITAVLGYLSAVLVPGLNRLGVALSDWAVPPEAKPTVTALPSNDERQILLSVGNDGEKLTTVVAVHFCTAKHAWFAYDPRTIRDSAADATGRDLAAAQREEGGPEKRMLRRWTYNVGLWSPLTPEEYQDLRANVERNQWVVECKPLEKHTLRKVSGSRKIKPHDSNEIAYEAPEGVTLAVSESGFSMVGGNTWCALTVRFSTDRSVSRVYLCKTDEGFGWKPSREDDSRSTAPELRAAPALPPEN